jgi:hypothetical protein
MSRIVHCLSFNQSPWGWKWINSLSHTIERIAVPGFSPNRLRRGLAVVEVAPDGHEVDQLV